MIEQNPTARAGAGEWVPIHDANGRLLFELSLVSGAIRIRRRNLTSVVDVVRARDERLRSIVGY